MNQNGISFSNTRAGTANDFEQDWMFGNDGRLTFPAGGSINVKHDIPAHSFGSPGDVPGMIAIDSSYFYYCSGTYDGSTDIWHRVVWTNNTW